MVSACDPIYPKVLTADLEYQGSPSHVPVYCGSLDQRIRVVYNSPLQSAAGASRLPWSPVPEQTARLAELAASARISRLFVNTIRADLGGPHCLSLSA
ncbi:hypothetical protein RRG08_031250 [Elysia crispata]|uniref:Uncharacterized protein n=1 Tax=Elysia crispata TaxID=231223 RepID=A0AAE1DZE1_9GAST|nr:hypothetical protein RRG08_031250 [Elysia crispata]